MPSLSTTLPQAGQLRRTMQPPAAPFLSAEIHRAWSLREAASPRSLLLRCLFRRWSCGHNNSGHCFGGARSRALLQMGCRDGLDAHLCSLTLLLKLLQLLSSEETHWLIASNEFGTCWHGREDDVATQPTEIGSKVAFDDGGCDHALALHWLANHRKRNCDSGRQFPRLGCGHNCSVNRNLSHGGGSSPDADGGACCPRGHSHSL